MTTHEVDNELACRIVQLAEEYTDEVRLRRSAGDANPQYHAQRTKVKAYGLLVRAGLSPKEAVRYFRSVSKEQ